MTTTGAKVRKTLAILSVMVIIPVAGHAFGPYGGTGKTMGPPQEAIDACKDLNKGDLVQFTTCCGATVSGVCREVGGGLVAVPEGRGRGLHRGIGPGNRAARLSKALNLTEAQQEQVKAILESERETTAPLRQQLAAKREKIREATLAQPFDESTVRALMEDQGKTRVELALSRARTKSRIYALLTPEQRESAAKLGQGGKRRHGRHHGW